MTTITDADRDAAEAVELINAICELADLDAIDLALPIVLSFTARHREAALEDAAKVVEAKPMRFAGTTEAYVRKTIATAIRALKGNNDA